jgi:WD40 repeat protein
VKLDLSDPAWRTTLPTGRSIAGDAPVAACAFNKDGSLVAFALGDGRVRLLPADIKAGEILAGDPVHGGAVLALVGDPAGDGFVSGGDDGLLLRIRADGSTSEITNQKGKWFEHLAAHRATGAVAASAGKTAFVVKDGEVREFGPHDSTVAGLDFSKDGSRIACAHYGGVTVWSIGQISRPPRRFDWSGSHVALKWSTDGRFIATGTQENDIHVWRVAEDKSPGMRMQGYPAKVKSLSWTADARFLYTSAQPLFTAWPFSGKGPEGKPPVQIGEQGAGLMTVVAARTSGPHVAGGYDSGELQLGDIRRSVVLKMADGSAITCLAWSPDGFKLAVGNERGDLLVVDLRR